MCSHASEIRHSEMRAFVSNLVWFQVRSVLFLIYLYCFYLRLVYTPEMVSANMSTGLTASVRSIIAVPSCAPCIRELISNTSEVQGGPGFSHRCSLVSAAAN